MKNFTIKYKKTRLFDWFFSDRQIKTSHGMIYIEKPHLLKVLYGEDNKK